MTHTPDFGFTNLVPPAEPDHQSMVDLRKSLAASALLVFSEGLAASGLLPARQEMHLRILIAEVRTAFGPSIPERELPENVVAITRGK